MLVPCFLLFFVSEILVRKYSRNRTKSITPSIKDREDDGVRRAPGEEPPGAHTIGRRGLGWGRAQLGCGGPGWPPAPILRLYIPPDAKTLIRKIISHEKFRRGRHRQSQIGGVLTFSRHPAGGEIITGGFYIIMPASGVMRE